MGRLVRGPLLGTAVALAAVLGGAGLSTARAEVRWLCHPTKVAAADDPCRGDQTTTRTDAAGATRVEPVAVPAAPPVDCFYVYPTVSNQPTPNASAAADPEIRSIAVFQAQRFSTRCRVYSPLYREVTAAGVTLAGQTGDTSAYTLAYGDVREAFRAFVREESRGRGFVLIGHSQGSRMLRAILRNEIDDDPVLRARLVAAIIPGANFTSQDVDHVPTCSAPGQAGCIMSWHTFNATPPDNARFGRTDTDPVGSALELPSGPGRRVACVDPARLAGNAGPLQTLIPTEAFAPGVIALLLLKLYGGLPPSADTPWLEPRERYTARCEEANGATVLMLTAVGDARKLDPSPDATWGVHLVDLNLPFGDVLANLGAQIRTYFAVPGRRGALKVTLRSHRLGSRTRVLLGSVTGTPGARFGLVLRRGTVVAGSRRGRIGADGRAAVRFAVRRAGTYQASLTVGSRHALSRAVRVTLR